MSQGWIRSRRAGVALLSLALLVLPVNSGVASAAEAAATCSPGYFCIYGGANYVPRPSSIGLDNNYLARCTPTDVGDGVYSSAINNSRYTIEVWNLKGRNSKRLVATLRPGERVSYFGSVGNDTPDRIWNLSCA